MALNYSIDVAAASDASTTTQGNIFEAFCRRFLKAEGYSVTSQVYTVAGEADLYATNDETGETILAECKSQKSTIRKGDIAKLCGKRDIDDCSSGWLITAAALGKGARGIKLQWKGWPEKKKTRLRFFDPDDLIPRLVELGLICDPSVLREPRGYRSAEEARLVIMELGEYWAVPVSDQITGLRNAYALYHAKTGLIVQSKDVHHLIRETRSQLSNLHWITSDQRTPVTSDEDLRNEFQSIVQVSAGEQWSDYRPSRPVDFIGRQGLLKSIFNFFDRVRKNETQNRLLAIKGPSGWGKSSLVLKVAAQSQSRQNAKKYFVFAVDSRSASSKRFGEFALALTVKEAIKTGFLSDPGQFSFGGIDDPFATLSMRSVAEQLKREDKILCLFFDQFEELLYREELGDCFEQIRILCDSIDASRENFVIAFSWKTGGSSPFEHSAYKMWQDIADRRTDFEITPFTEKEVSAALKKFEDVLGEKLVPQLRQMLKDSCQGLPWLLKKLCIHVFHLVQSGKDQTTAVFESLQIERLFERDVEVLSESEDACLREIAKEAPARYFYIRDNYGDDVINSLVNSRLVVKAGAKLSIYWDIFRDYLLSKRVPRLPITYIPETSYGRYANAVELLLDRGAMPRTRFAKELGFDERRVSFVIQDLVTIGNATFDTGNKMVCPTSKSISQADTTIRQFFRAHDVYLRLTNEEADAKPVRFERLRKVVEESCRLGELGNFSRKKRASNLLMYMWGVGLASQRANGVLFHQEPVKDGRSIADAQKFMHRRTKAYIFFGEAPPAVVIGCLQSLIENPLSRADAEKAHGKNAIHALVKFGLLAIDGSPIIPMEKSRYSLPQIVSEAASQDEVISLVIRMLRDDPGVRNRFVGSRIGQIYKTNWVEKSKIRIGGAVLQWARWIERQKYGEKLNDAAWMKDRIRNLTNSTADRLFAMAVIVDEDTAAFRGRPKLLNAAATEAIEQLLDDGVFTQVELAKKLGLSRPSISRALASLRDRP